MGSFELLNVSTGKVLIMSTEKVTAFRSIETPRTHSWHSFVLQRDENGSPGIWGDLILKMVRIYSAMLTFSENLSWFIIIFGS